MELSDLPKLVIVSGIICFLGAWFIIGGRKSIWEKIGLLALIAGFYIIVRLGQGAGSMYEIFYPIFRFFQGNSY